MPFFLVELPDGIGTTRFAKSMVVAAESIADAKVIAKSKFDGDGGASWDAATVTLLTEVLADAVDAFLGWKVRVAIIDITPVIDITVTTGKLGALSAVVAAGGTGYSADEILTVAGGTATRAARFRITGETGGVVDTVELVDPGEYTALPSNPAGTTGGSGTGATLTLTESTHALANYLAQFVTLLNATVIDNASLDMGATNPLLVIATGSGGDDLGDKTVIVEVIPPGVAGKPLAGIINTLTDGGVATDALSVDFDVLSGYTVPLVLQTFS